MNRPRTGRSHDEAKKSINEAARKRRELEVSMRKYLDMVAIPAEAARKMITALRTSIKNEERMIEILEKGQSFEVLAQLAAEAEAAESKE